MARFHFAQQCLEPLHLHTLKRVVLPLALAYKCVCCLFASREIVVVHVCCIQLQRGYVRAFTYILYKKLKYSKKLDGSLLCEEVTTLHDGNYLL